MAPDTHSFTDVYCPRSVAIPDDFTGSAPDPVVILLLAAAAETAHSRACASFLSLTSPWARPQPHTIRTTCVILTASPHFRFTLDTLAPHSEMNFILLVICISGLPQAVIPMKGSGQHEEPHEEDLNKKLTTRERMLTRSQRSAVVFTTIKTGMCITFIGMLPGVGLNTAAFLPYIRKNKTNTKRNAETGEGALVRLASADMGLSSTKPSGL